MKVKPLGEMISYDRYGSLVINALVLAYIHIHAVKYSTYYTDFDAMKTREVRRSLKTTYSIGIHCKILQFRVRTIPLCSLITDSFAQP